MEVKNGVLRFLGRGSAFHTDNNSAFFTKGSSLVLLDCPTSAFHKLRHIGVDTLTGCEADKVIVLVTHTHTDHVGGVGMLIHYCYYMLHLPVEVIAPSREVAEDVGYLIRRLDGCNEQGYKLLTADEAGYDWIVTPILTHHTAELEGRCFGWCLEIGGQRVVYTGDTCTLEPFVEYLTQGAYLYTELSAYDTLVHLGADVLLRYEDVLKQRQIKVFLMHLDNEQVIAQGAEKLGAQLAPLYHK